MPKWGKIIKRENRKFAEGKNCFAKKKSKQYQKVSKF